MAWTSEGWQGSSHCQHAGVGGWCCAAGGAFNWQERGPQLAIPWPPAQHTRPAAAADGKQSGGMSKD